MEYIIYQKEAIHDLIVTESVKGRHDIGALVNGPCLALPHDFCGLAGCIHVG